MLADGGGIPAFGHIVRSELDIGEDVVVPYLRDRGIRSLDIIAIGPAHDDHIGGIPALVSDFHPREIWTGATPDSPAWNAVRERAALEGARTVPMQAGRRFEFGGGEFEVLAPPPGYTPLDEPKNNDSPVLRLCYGERSFLLNGDVERPIEREMVDMGEVRPADVLKVAHHGSRTSSRRSSWMRCIRGFAVISAGFENSYGHSHPMIVDRLAEHHATILRTDRDGPITIRTATGYTWRRSRGCSGTDELGWVEAVPKRGDTERRSVESNRGAGLCEAQEERCGGHF
jgi:competence protein ComEC